MENGGEGTMGSPLMEGRRRVSGGATCCQTLGNFVVSILGTGALGLPYAFRVAGWLSASLSLLLVAMAICYSMILLVQCRRKLEEEEEEESDGCTQTQTFSDVGAKAFGMTGRGLTELLILTSHAGGCVSFFIFMGQNLSTLTSNANFSPSLFIVLVLLPLEIALSFVRSLSLLAPFSIFATLCNVFAMLAVVMQYIEQLNGLPTLGSPNAYNGAESIPFVCGVALFCFEGMGMTLPLEGSMAEQRRFPWMLLPALLGMAVAYVCFGAFGYVAYGDATKEIVILNLPDNWSAVAVKAGLCVAVAFALPIGAHPIHEIIEMKLKSSRWFQKHCHRSKVRDWFGSQVARIMVLAVLALLATSFPGFVQVMSLTGSTVCALIAFVLPASCHLKLMGSSLGLWQRVADYFLLFVGLVFASYGTYTAILGHPVS